MPKVSVNNQDRCKRAPGSAPSCVGAGGREVLRGLALLAMVLVVYVPVMGGDFLWDDDAWTSRIAHLLGSLSGLWRMWTEPTALQQYFPLTGTSFWLDHRLWGSWTVPYHLENIFLHGLGAVLFWRVLVRLKVPGAWMAAAVFALHPMHVESVAWITERKNVLSLVLYLGALYAYGMFAGFWGENPPKGLALCAPEPRRSGVSAERRHSPRQFERGSAETPLRGAVYGRGAGPVSGVSGEEEGERTSRWGAYAGAVCLFAAAYLAKATAFSLPAVLLLIAWWKRGRVVWKKDVLPALPFFVLAIGLGLLVSWLEPTHVGARGEAWQLPFPERCLVAGRALWFYVWKLVWPFGFCFIYPRWAPDGRSLAQWVYPVAAGGAMLGLWLGRRRMGRGPVAAVFFYAGALFPLLGFINGYFQLYSFVSDHWVYLPSLGLIALAAGCASRALEAVHFRRLAEVAGVAVLCLLAGLTWRHCYVFQTMDSLWSDTLDRNPKAWMAHHNRGLQFQARGQLAEAEGCYRTVLSLHPKDAPAHNNLGVVLAGMGRVGEAIEEYEAAIEADPNFADAQNNLAGVFAQLGNYKSALEHQRKAVELDPRTSETWLNLGQFLKESGDLPEAVAAYRKAAALAPGEVEPRRRLGSALLAMGQASQAIAAYEDAVRLAVNRPDLFMELGNALAAQTNYDAAAASYRSALRLEPTNAFVFYNLGAVLREQGRTLEARTNMMEAVRLNPSLSDAVARLLQRASQAKPLIDANKR